MSFIFLSIGKQLIIKTSYIPYVNSKVNRKDSFLTHLPGRTHRQTLVIPLRYTLDIV